MSKVDRLAALQRAGQRIVMITAYDAPSARIVEAAGVDVVLVGDSAATTVLGYETTREVSLAEMLMLTRAVRRGLNEPVLIGDLPFGAYEDSDAQALETARAFMDAGCDGVKLEGADGRVARVTAVVRAGIPVMGHVGLEPQSVRTADGYRVRGRDADAAMVILDHARDLERAGCFALVVEAVPRIVADALVAEASIPVIGIGASSSASGQVLVYHDLLGLLGSHHPKFVKQYAESASRMIDAVRLYAREVRDGTFPAAEHSYEMPDAERAAFEARLEERRHGKNRRL